MSSANESDEIPNTISVMIVKGFRFMPFARQVNNQNRQGKETRWGWMVKRVQTTKTERCCLFFKKITQTEPELGLCCGLLGKGQLIQRL